MTPILLLLAISSFLAGTESAELPDPNVMHMHGNRLPSQREIQQLNQHFCSRWSKEFLAEENRSVRSGWRRLSTYRLTSSVIVEEDPSLTVLFRYIPGQHSSPEAEADDHKTSGRQPAPTKERAFDHQALRSPSAVNHSRFVSHHFDCKYCHEDVYERTTLATKLLCCSHIYTSMVVLGGNVFSRLLHLLPRSISGTPCLIVSVAFVHVLYIVRDGDGFSQTLPRRD